MIYEALNDNVMLLELSQEEMIKYRITYEIIEKDESSARKVMRNILSRTDAGERLENGENVTVEALPVPNGGCFFILTFTEKKTRYKVRKEPYYVFETENLDDLLDFISAIRKTKTLNCKCKAYKMSDRYYLSIPRNSTRAIRIMGEFGKRSDMNTYRLSEYGYEMGEFYLQ